MTPGLVLSVFPGIDLLGRAFEEEGYTIVRGPDVLWGGDIRSFHPPAGVFDGVIGGPPCQAFSALVHLVRAQGHEPRFGNLIPEFERVVAEAAPCWWLMENVPAAPVANVAGYVTEALIFNNRWTGAEQNRVRRFCFGTADGRKLHPEVAALEAPVKFVAVATIHGLHSREAMAKKEAKAAVISGNGFGSGSDYYKRADGLAVTSRPKGISQTEARRYKRAHVAVTSNVGGYSAEQAKLVHGAACDTSSDGAGKVRQVRYTLAEACRLQGLPEDFLTDAPFTAEGKLKAVANGVPLPMGRAIAAAVKRAMSTPTEGRSLAASGTTKAAGLRST